MTKAEFVAGRIEEGYSPEGTGPIRSVRVTYCYYVNHIRYAGDFIEAVDSAGEGAQLLRSLEAGPLFVRYSPTRPHDSVMDPYRDVRT